MPSHDQKKVQIIGPGGRKVWVSPAVANSQHIIPIGYKPLASVLVEVPSEEEQKPKRGRPRLTPTTDAD